MDVLLKKQIIKGKSALKTASFIKITKINIKITHNLHYFQWQIPNCQNCG